MNIHQVVFDAMKKLGIHPGLNTPSCMWGMDFYSPERKRSGVAVSLHMSQQEALRNALDGLYDLEINRHGNLCVYAPPSTPEEVQVIVDRWEMMDDATTYNPYE